MFRNHGQHPHFHGANSICWWGLFNMAESIKTRTIPSNLAVSNQIPPEPFFNYLTQWRKMLFSANYKGKHTLPCTFLHLLFGWSKVYSVSPTNALGRAAWRHISDFVPYFSSAKMGNLKKATSIKFIVVQTDQKPSDSCHMGENKLWLIDRRFSINTLELKCFKK